MANIGGDRALKVCDVCGGVDDHPRHEFAGALPGQPIAPPVSEEAVRRVNELAPEGERSRLLRDLYDQTTVQRHYDCCRAVGCPVGVCDVITRGAEDKRGSALEKHLAKARGSTVFDDRDDIVWANTDEGQR